MGQGVIALMSARAGGFSSLPYDTCNLGDHVSDDLDSVRRNREVFARAIQAEPCWLTQVHGARILRLEAGRLLDGAAQHRADGVVCTEPGLACTVMVADCLPLLLAAPEGRGVAALHAGWRGLAGAGEMRGKGVVHAGVQALCDASACDPADVRAWLGPCIGPEAFEVGADVLQAFGVDPMDGMGHVGQSSPWFKPVPIQVAAPFLGHDPAQPFGASVGQGPSKWLADLPGLARRILQSLGVVQVTGGAWCTFSQSARYFSFRRDGVTGRQAAGIALRPR